MFSLKPCRRRRAALVAVVATVAVGGGFAAYAYWTANGTGQGTATTGTASSLQITSSAPVGAALTPGGPSQTVAFTVANPGTGTQTLSSMYVAVRNPDGSTWASVTGCSAADYAIGAVTVTFGQIAGGSQVSGSVPVSMVNSNTNQDACQGVSVPLYFSTQAIA